MSAFKSLFLLAVFSQPFNIKASDFNVVLPIGGLFNKLSDDASKQIFKDYGMKERSYFGHYIYSNVTEDGYSTSLDVCDYTSHDSTLTAIIDARPSHGVCDNICLLCNKLNISHLSLAWEPIESVSDTQFTLNYHPPPEVISKAYAAHIRKTDWDRFSILYEDDGSFIRLQEVINSWRTDIQPIYFKKLYPYGDNRETFKYILKVARLSYHIIDCKSENIVKYMKEMLEIEQNTAYQTILLTSLDAYAVDLRTIDFNGNISTWHLTKPSQEFWSDQGIDETPKLHTYLTVDALNHLENSIKAMVDNTEDGDDWIFDLPINVPPALCYKNTSEEYVKAAWKYGPALRDALLQTTKMGLTGNIQFDENGKRTNFILHHSEFHDDINKFVHAGQWNSTTNKIEEFGKKPVKKTTHFKVITTVNKPYYTPGVNGSEGTGYVVDLMEAIFKKINEQEKLLFTYDISVGTNNKIGNPIEGSRRWDGLIGDIIEHKADLAICDLTITSDRHAVVDFSIPFMNLGISMLFPVTPPPKPNMFSFVGPLATDVWLYLAVVYLFVSLVLLICARMSQDDWVNPHPCNQNPENLENIWSLYNCMWLTMGSIMTQGCDILPRGYGSRWIAGTWYFFALIVTASYTANMSTFISNNRREGKIEDIKALSEQKDISYGAMINGSTYKFFESSNDTIIQKLWHTMSTSNPTVFTESNTEGKDRVVQSEKGEYVFFMESTTIEYFIKQDCRLKMVGSKLDSKEYGVAMPKNSPYKHYFNAAILSLQEKLDLQKIKEKWWVKDPESPMQENCPEVDEDDSGSLKMKNTSGIFLVLGFGGILGLIIAIIGFLLHAHDICVTEKVTYKEALRSEWKASLDPFALNKAAAPPRSAPPSAKSSCTPRERSKSRAVSVLRAAQSFINFDDIY